MIQPGDAYAPADLTECDHFLTARFRLYSLSRGELRFAQIEHPPWPLARAKALQVHQTLFPRLGLPEFQGTPLIHYASDLAVKIGRLALH